jgi:serine/threonine-protein kinase
LRTTNQCFFSAILSLVIFFICSCNKITTPGGSSISDISITALNPSHGPFDTIDTLIGKGFDQIPTLDSVLLNGKKLTLISRSPNQIIVEIPAMAGTGNIDIGYKGSLIHGPVFTYDSVFLVTTLAGSTDAGSADGQGLDARFNLPTGIALDQSGNIYVADRGNSSIRKITPGGAVTTLAGPADGQMAYVDGTGPAARFSAPLGLTIDGNGSLYVADMYNYCVRKVSLSGVVTTLAGHIWTTGPPGGEVDGDASVATFDTPYGVSVDANGNVFVADINNNRIRKVTPAGIVSTLAGGDYYHYGQQDGQGSSALFFNPWSVVVDPSDNVYVIDDENHLLRKITPDGTVKTLLGPMEPSITGTDQLFFASALAADKAGNIFFSVSYGIFKMTPDGSIIRYAIGGIGDLDGALPFASFRAISGIAVDSSGNLYITDNNRVRKIGWQ